MAVLCCRKKYNKHNNDSSSLHPAIPHPFTFPLSFISDILPPNLFLISSPHSVYCPPSHSPLSFLSTTFSLALTLILPLSSPVPSFPSTPPPSPSLSFLFSLPLSPGLITGRSNWTAIWFPRQCHLAPPYSEPLYCSVLSTCLPPYLQKQFHMLKWFVYLLKFIIWHGSGGQQRSNDVFSLQQTCPRIKSAHTILGQNEPQQERYKHAETIIRD